MTFWSTLSSLYVRKYMLLYVMVWLIDLYTIVKDYTWYLTTALHWSFVIDSKDNNNEYDNNKDNNNPNNNTKTMKTTTTTKQQFCTLAMFFSNYLETFCSIWCFMDNCLDWPEVFSNIRTTWKCKDFLDCFFKPSKNLNLGSNAMNIFTLEHDPTRSQVKS